MALIHWWPLNGDTKDYGLNPVSLVASGAAVNASGKIGQCYSFDGTDDYLSITSSDLYKVFSGGSQEFSMTMWIYNDDGAAGSLADRSVLFGDYNLSGAQQFTIEKYSGQNGTNNRVRFYWAGSPDTAISGSAVLTPSAWSHLAVVYDGTKILCYINGSLVGSWTGTLATKSKTSGAYYYGRDSRTGNTAFKGRMNDLRIYDHALSLKEIKDISKGLILHYTFEDENVEGTTNLVTSLSAGGRTSVVNNTIVTNGQNGDIYFYLNLSSALVEGTTYTISCDAEIPSGGTGAQWKFGMGSQSASDPNFIINNGHNEYTFVSTTNSSKNKILFDDINRIYGVSSVFKNFQIEQKNHATPYVIGTRSSGNIDDNSGYEKTISYVSGTSIIEKLASNVGIGDHDILLQGNAIYRLNTPYTQNAKTASFWIKCPTYPSSNTVVFADQASSLSFGFYSTSYGIIKANTPATRYVSNLKSLWKENTWNFVVVTKDDSEVYHCYVNGVEGTYNSSSPNYWTHNTDALLIGGRYNSGYQLYANVQLADFKMYSTYFSAADVLKEYKSLANIDKKYNLSAYKFNEDDDQITYGLLEGDGVFDTKSIRETSFPASLYTPIEYLQSTGAQRIKLEITPTSTYKIEEKFAITDRSVTSCIWCARGNSTGTNSLTAFNIANSQLRCDYGVSAAMTNIGTLTANQIYTLTMDSNKWLLDGTQKTAMTAANFTAGGAIELFASYYSGQDSNLGNYSKMKLYYFKVWNKNRVLVGDYVPVKRNSDNKPGLFDMVSGKFYVNSETGADFTAGSAISIIPKINFFKTYNNGELVANQFYEK